MAEHIVRLDDPTLLPLARSRIAAMRASGLQSGAQRFSVGGADVTAQIKGAQSYVSISGGPPLEMDSGIIDVGAVTLTNPDRYVRGKRKVLPEYEDGFTKNLQKKDADGVLQPTPWYLKPGGDGQIAGILKLSTHITGKVRKDDVTSAFAPRSSPPPDPEDPVVPGAPEPDEVDGRVYELGNERLLSKKRAGVYCPASMFTGRTRLYVQAMYGRPLYTQEGEEVPTPQANISGWPYLILPAYKGEGIVTLTSNSGVYFDPVSKKHWLLNPDVGSITIYPLVASKDGELARKRLRGTSLDDADKLHLETYVLSTCRPDVANAVTLSITPITNWAAGYGWHWNWSGTTADMVRVVSAQDRVPFDYAMYSTHYRIEATCSDDTWTATASTVSGPHLFMVMTPVCCVIHPNWTNRYVGEDLEHAPIFWSEKLTLNAAANFSFNDVPLYAFYKKDELQVARLTLEIGEAIPGYMSASDKYVEMKGTGPIDFELRGVSLGDDSAFLYVTYETSAPYDWTLTCGGESVTVRRGAHELSYTVDDSEKTQIDSPPGFGDWAFPGAATGITLRYGPPLADGVSWDFIFVGQPGSAEGGWGAAYQGAQFYNTSEFTRTTATLDKQWHGNCGGIIPFYDAEAFYLVQDTWHETIDSGRAVITLRGQFWGNDCGKVLTPTATGYQVTYVGWSKFSMYASGTGEVSRTTTPDELTVESEVKQLITVASAGTSTVSSVPGSAYEMFADGDTDFVGETFNTISSAGTDKLLYSGIAGFNWPDIPGLVRPVIVGWV